MGTTKAKMKSLIDSKLGASGRAVELREEDYATAVSAALKMLARWHPMISFKVIPISTGVQKYDLGVPNVLGVRDLTFFNNGGRFTAYPYPDASVDHILILSQLKMQEKAYGDLPQWEFQMEAIGDADTAVETGFIYIYMNSDSFLDRAGRIPTHISVEYLSYIEYSDSKTVGLPRLRYDWQEWVDKYAVAEAKKILGGIRDKFKGIPGPDGNALSINGESLIEQGEREITALTEDISQRARQLPILID